VTGPLGLIYPVLVQVLLTLVLVVMTGRTRIEAITTGQVRTSDIALDNTAWPVRARQISNNLHNQFETPVLFFVLCGIAIYVGAAGTFMVLLAWAFIATRLVHTAIHITSNRVSRRFFAFTAGLVVLAAMWLAIIVHLLFGA
jgi:hypothetical protein